MDKCSPTRIGSEGSRIKDTSLQNPIRVEDTKEEECLEVEKVIVEECEGDKILDTRQASATSSESDAPGPSPSTSPSSPELCGWSKGELVTLFVVAVGAGAGGYFCATAEEMMNNRRGGVVGVTPAGSFSGGAAPSSGVNSEGRG